jgi:glycosyltransferase involved in cell wall biosynthesis
LNSAERPPAYLKDCALSSLGLEVDLVTYHVGKDVNMPGVRIHRTPRIPLIKSVKIGPSWPKLFLDILVFIKSFFLLTGKKYDVTHSHEEAAFFCLVLARILRVCHIYDMHSSLPKQLGNFQFGNWWPLVKLFEFLEGQVLKTCDAVITADEELEKYVKGKHPQIRGHLVEILGLHTGRNPADPNFAKEVRISLASNGKLPVVYIGSFESHHGLELLIDSAEIVCQHDPKAILILVGGNRDQIEQYRAKVTKNDLQSSINFMGIVPPEEIIAYLSIAEVLVSPWAKGTSTLLSVYSYLHPGKPIVATKLGAHVQVLNDRVALLSEPTKESLAEGILKLLSDPQLRTCLGQQAKQFVEDIHNLKDYVARIDNVYNNLHSSERIQDRSIQAIEK